MKFGIFYEIQLPRSWEPDDEWRLYQKAPILTFPVIPCHPPQVTHRHLGTS